MRIYSQLNVIWSGTLPSRGREEKLLEEAVTYTQGLFLLGNTSHMTSSKDSPKLFSKEVMGTKVQYCLFSFWIFIKQIIIYFRK